MKWLELLKVGTWTDRFGKAREITSDLLDSIVKNFDPEKSPVHFTVGHPDKPKVPSFGLAGALKRVGDVLKFQPGTVVPEFAALVARGGFPSISAGLDEKMSRLDHIAFLSAQAPAIKGLSPICEFSAPDGDGKIVHIDVTSNFKHSDFSAPDNWFRWRINGIGRLLRNLKNNYIEKQGQETADKLFDEYELNQLVGDPPDNTTQFSQPPSSGGTMDFEKLYNELLPQFTAQKTQLAEFTAVAAKPADVTALKTENAALKTKVADLEAGKRKAEFSAFVETQIAAGKVLPDQKDAEVAMLETLHAATPAEFSSANGAKSPVDQYKENLGKRPKVAPETGASGARGPEFSAPIDDPVAIGMRARDYIAEQRVKGVAVDAIAAVAHVRKNG